MASLCEVALCTELVWWKDAFLCLSDELTGVCLQAFLKNLNLKFPFLRKPQAPDRREGSRLVRSKSTREAKYRWTRTVHLHIH